MEFQELVEQNIELAREQLGALAPAERILRAAIEKSLREQFTALDKEGAEDYLAFSVPLMYPTPRSVLQ